MFIHLEMTVPQLLKPSGACSTPRQYNGTPVGMEAGLYQKKIVCRVSCNASRGRRSTSSSNFAQNPGFVWDGMLGRDPFTCITFPA